MANRPPSNSVRVSYGGRENRLIEAGGAPFRVERLRRRGRILRVRDRLLQQRHAHLRPVVRVKRRGQKLGQQDLRLSELRDNLNLGSHKRLTRFSFYLRLRRDAVFAANQ